MYLCIIQIQYNFVNPKYVRNHQRTHLNHIRVQSMGVSFQKHENSLFIWKTWKWPIIHVRSSQRIEMKECLENSEKLFFNNYYELMFFSVRYGSVNNYWHYQNEKYNNVIVEWRFFIVISILFTSFLKFIFTLFKSSTISSNRSTEKSNKFKSHLFVLYQWEFETSASFIPKTVLFFNRTK